MFLFLVSLSRKEQIAEQREYKKKKAQKKVQRMKELEQEREEQKSKWQQFNNKAYSKNKKGQVFIIYFFIFHLRGKAVEQTSENFVILCLLACSTAVAVVAVNPHYGIMFIFYRQINSVQNEDYVKILVTVKTPSSRPCAQFRRPLPV